jgi:F-type H+-transporting ATPase subunit b
VREALDEDKRAQAIVDRFLADLEADETAQKAGSGN